MMKYFYLLFITIVIHIELHVSLDITDTFSFAKSLTILNSVAETLLDYPVSLVIEKEAGMQSNYSDLRFVNQSCDSINEKISSGEESYYEGDYFVDFVMKYEVDSYNENNATIWLLLSNFHAYKSHHI